MLYSTNTGKMKTWASSRDIMDNNHNRQWAEWNTVFELIDQNKDCELCAEDVKRTMKKLGQDVSDEQISRFIRRASSSDGSDGVGRRNSSVKQEEFIDWMQQQTSEQDDPLKDAFTLLDSDKDGYLIKVELKKGMDMLGIKLSDSIFNLMFKEADKDRDGKISFKEFLEMLQ